MDFITSLNVCLRTLFESVLLNWSLNHIMRIHDLYADTLYLLMAFDTKY